MKLDKKKSLLQKRKWRIRKKINGTAEHCFSMTPADSSRHAKAMFGTVRSIINNMVIGVVEGYKKEIVLKGGRLPCRPHRQRS